MRTWRDTLSAHSYYLGFSVYIIVLPLVWVVLCWVVSIGGSKWTHMWTRYLKSHSRKYETPFYQSDTMIFGGVSWSKTICLRNGCRIPGFLVCICRLVWCLRPCRWAAACTYSIAGTSIYFLKYYLLFFYSFITLRFLFVL